MKTETDGLVLVTLNKPWGAYKSGSKIEVEPAKAVTLKARGFVGKSKDK